MINSSPVVEDVATAATMEEAKELAATGFDYFTTMNGFKSITIKSRNREKVFKTLASG
ncbi:MAG: hypothetical protein ACUVRA_04830 [Candidatus Bathyarchaeaceae archaeon]